MRATPFCRPRAPGIAACKEVRIFFFVGAYPSGQDCDICRSAPSQAMLMRIASLGFPDADPITCNEGPWQAG
jgi:uncharacterized protein YjlB